ARAQRQRHMGPPQPRHGRFLQRVPRDPLLERPDLLQALPPGACAPTVLRLADQVGISRFGAARFAGLLPRKQPLRTGAGRDQPVPQGPMTTTQRSLRTSPETSPAPVSILLVDDDPPK